MERDVVTEQDQEDINSGAEETPGEPAETSHIEALAAALSHAVPAPEVQLSPKAPVKGGFVWGTGRRKSSVARVRLKDGTGKIEVNSKQMVEFFPTEQAQRTVTQPLRITETLETYDIFVNVQGGGITGQAGAVRLGIGRALKGIEPTLEAALREAGLLTRDSRMKERKKYGLRGARRAYQFSKR